MPALWPKFIPDLADTIASQQFTKPGGLVIGYKPPVQLSAIGNPANAALKSNPAEYINVFNPNPLSGRYDFGIAVAEHYIEAVKSYATTHVMATHTNNPIAELILKQGYGIAHERLLREGDIPLMDQYDEDGNLITMGKESHPAYADFCPEIAAPPTEEELAELAKENDKAFNAFIADKKTEYNLYKFSYFQFPCLYGEESQSELEAIFAARLLQQFENLSSANKRWDFFLWAAHLGSEYYTGSSYTNINSQARSDITVAGYNWKKLADNVSLLVTNAILESRPPANGESSDIKVYEDAVKSRVRRNSTTDIILPHDLECPLNEYKIQVAYDFENTPENPSKRPKILTSNVVATFSYVSGVKTGVGAMVAGVWIPPKFIKSKNWVKTKYENTEWKKKWAKIPEAKLVAASKKTDAAAAFLQIDPLPEGTQFKFEFHKAKLAKEAADNCEEPPNVVDFPFEASGTTPDGDVFAGDPYEMLAKVTIAYWYACIVKPFGPSPSAPPALIPPPLTGIYIPLYYGSANRLANNLRRAWNTGKTFSKIPAPQPPALAVSTAVAGAYALHLLEFKLLYLGGIPTPVGPIPMVGFVPIVF